MQQEVQVVEYFLSEEAAVEVGSAAVEVGSETLMVMPTKEQKNVVECDNAGTRDEKEIDNIGNVVSKDDA